LIIRRLEDKDLESLMHLVNITMWEVNTETYPDELIEQWVDEQKDDEYVFHKDNMIEIEKKTFHKVLYI